MLRNHGILSNQFILQVIDYIATPFREKLRKGDLIELDHEFIGKLDKFEIDLMKYGHEFNFCKIVT
ncbi:hypothetical protein FF021_19965 [Leptospira noguchii]|uniref:hypothetical protein n=1 Tax=Leptospira noguchii TaxID=28182 RepID=UPI001167640F|nr:hypothetical protein [Leptospira noguchii]TQE64093.1 hypothetical protein FF021_19965 [Leptospira noguchii]UOG51705.1 hypothetical protein MAL09_13565 [Leptospira noguchii]